MANNAVVGLLRVLLTADTAQFSAEMKRVSSQADDWSKSLGSMGRQATAVGEALTKTLTLPILGLGAASAKAAMDFESSFAGVRKTVDATEPELAALAQQFRDLAKTIPVNVNELNRLGEAAGALGIPKQEIKEFTRVMAMLGVTTNLTADQAADSIARMQNIFGAAGKDTEKLASTLVALGNAGASTEKEILEMGLRIAGAGHTVGLTQAQVLAFASTLASVGINAEAGGSAISRVFLKIHNAVSDGGAALAEFARVAGMSSAEFKKAFETDAASATAAFVKGLERLKGEGENVNATIEGLVGKNIILKDTLLRLAGAGELLTTQLTLGNKAWEESNALSIEANKRFETTASQLTLLWNRIRDVGITIGNALLPAIKSLIDLTSTFLPLLDSLAQGFAALPGGVQLTIIAFAGLAAAAGPVIYALGQLLISARAVTAAFGAKGIATRLLGQSMGILPALLSPVSIALMGIGAAALYATNEIGKLKRKQEELASAQREQTALLEAYRVVVGDSTAEGLDFTRMTEEQRIKLKALAQQTAEQRMNLGGLTVSLGDAKAGMEGVSAAATEEARKQKALAAELAKTTKAKKDAEAAAKKLAEMYGVVLLNATEEAVQGIARMVDEMTQEIEQFGVVLMNETEEAVGAVARMVDGIAMEMDAVGVVILNPVQEAVDQVAALVDGMTRRTPSVLQGMLESIRGIFNADILRDLFVKPAETALRILESFLLSLLDRLLQKGLDKLFDIMFGGNNNFTPMTPGITPIGGGGFNPNPGSGLGIPTLASGGFIQQPTLAFLHANEAVVPLEQMPAFFGGGTTIVFEEDGRQMAEYSVRNLPGAVRRIRRWSN